MQFALKSDSGALRTQGPADNAGDHHGQVRMGQV